MLLIILLLSLASHLPAPVQRFAVISRGESVSPYEAIWNAVCHVESSGNPNAIGDTNMEEWSYGIAQVRRARLEDYARRTGVRYTVTDMFDPAKARRVFMHFAEIYGPYEIERFVKSWNGSGPMVEIYWSKIQSRL